MAPIDTATLNSELTTAGARWTARENAQSNLSLEEKRALLGMIVSDSDQALAENPPAAAVAAGLAAFPPAVDWRNRNGNHVTPVKDQKQCGSCVSFCCAGLVESMASIELGQLIDLSEADSHFNSNHGPSCGGWWAEDCLEQIKQRGVVSEAALPYMNVFDSPPQPDPLDPSVWIAHTRPTPNRAATQVSITSHGSISDIAARKTYLSDHGPCAASFDVYEDFYSYGTGVYEHVSGAYVGGHCVEVIGYSEAEQCWIAKNSWGTGWGGASGYFRIGYGECNFDTYAFATAQGVKLPSTHGWSGYEGLGGILTSKPSATSWAANRIDVVARGADSAVQHRWFDGAHWNGWESLGGSCQSGPAICSRGANRLDVFVVGRDHALAHKWYQGGWSAWENLGGLLSSDPSAVSRSPNRIDIFARGMDSALAHLWWDGTHWAGWESLGGVIDSAPAVSSWSASRMDCFAKSTSNELLHKWWGGAGWSAWENLHGYVGGDPAAVSWGPNRIDVFYPGVKSHMMHKSWNGANWSGEQDLGGVLCSGVGACSWAPSRLDCFVEGSDSALLHKWYA